MPSSFARRSLLAQLARRGEISTARRFVFFGGSCAARSYFPAAYKIKAFCIIRSFVVCFARLSVLPALSCSFLLSFLSLLCRPRRHACAVGRQDWARLRARRKGFFFAFFSKKRKKALDKNRASWYSVFARVRIVPQKPRGCQDRGAFVFATKKATFTS